MAKKLVKSVCLMWVVVLLGGAVSTVAAKGLRASSGELPVVAGGEKDSLPYRTLGRMIAAFAAEARRHQSSDRERP